MSFYRELKDDERPVWLDMGAIRDEKVDSFFNGCCVGVVVAVAAFLIVILLTGCQPVTSSSTPTTTHGVITVQTTSTTTAQPMNQGTGDCKMVGADPDPICTPGAINPAVTQANISSTICKSGWTATVRPPLSYSSKLKGLAMGTGPYTISYQGQTWTDRGYNSQPKSRNDVELDHLVPLETGGAPADPHNLFPEPGGVAHYALLVNGVDGSSIAKDSYEGWVKRQICSGKLTLVEGQARFLGGHWFENYLQDRKPGQ
jgi:hypothetical protein